MPVPILSVAQMREWENATWATGVTAAAVIKNVGRVLARRVLELTAPGDTILILAGRGHNGDDARAARRLLPGRKVALLNVVDPASATREFSRRSKESQFAARPKWIIDGLFGIGLNRPLEGGWKNLIDTINAAGVSILAVDVPSGLNADTGQSEGAATRAEITLTIGAPKRGLLKAPNSVGRLEVASDVGLISCPATSEMNWTLPEDFTDWPARRPSESNKGSFGHVAIVAGSLGYHGAAVLTAHGALRARPGLVTVEPQESVYVPVASQLQAAMVRPWRAARPLPRGCTALLFGPGLAAEKLPAALKKEVRAHWKNFPGPMVVDASALDWLKPGSDTNAGLRVITPHPGEAGRLLGLTAKDVQSDRLKALRELSRRYGNCYVILKGNQTLVGRAKGNVFVNCSGNPLLAQGGSGDLLGGYLTGLLAQQTGQQDPLTTLRFAVWQHGAVADEQARLGRNMTVDDLAAEMGSAKP